MSDRAFIDHLLELFESFGPVAARRMFGGYGIFLDGLMFALVADSTLYLKVDAQNRSEFEALNLPPFVYMKNARPVEMSYYQAPAVSLESPEQMLPWAESAYAAAQRSKKR